LSQRLEENFGGVDGFETDLRDQSRRIAANRLLDHNSARQIRASYWFLSKLRRSALVWADQAETNQRERLLRAADERHERALVPTSRCIASIIIGTEINDEACSAFWQQLAGLEIAPDTDVEWFFVAAVLHLSQLPQKTN